MKISEFLQDFFQRTGPTSNVPIEQDYILTPAMLKIPQIQEGLLKCEEFENTKELIIMDNPSIEIEAEGGKTKKGHSTTIMLQEGIKFKEKVYLHSIFLTPTVWDAEDYMHPVKDDVCITPTTFDRIDFMPRQGIIVFFNTAELHALEGADEDYKNALIEKFKKALDNPSEYKIKERRVIMMRGLMIDSIEPPKEKEIDYGLLDKSLRDFIQITPEPKKQFVKL